ncbi:Hypothetical predicted protein [Paramuricea clavata]|uniref:Uncharacterized protein n=2 Tax=Paramuricea clavata TaxID=317549 RepID=A0A7D9HB45_PARCT|nr:Hypothetical predicted protein [Paramuricea clavata]CAB3988991.1 Hypothetical predicted protein [Paramuricea clavata]
MTGESRIRHHNLGDDAVGYAFHNAIYDDASEKKKTENMDDVRLSSSVELKNAQSDVVNVKPTETTSAFENPAFEEMSAC